MKKYILGLILISLISCDTYDHVLNRMKSPVIVVAKSNPVENIKRGYNNSITLIDGDGCFQTFNTDSPIGRALYDTYNVNDTVKKVNSKLF